MTEIKKSGRASEIGAKISIGATAKNPVAAVSAIPDMIFFYDSGEKLYPGILF